LFFLNWTVHLSAYPVLWKDHANGKLRGKSNYSNYDAHFIPVYPRYPDSATENTYFPCKLGETPVYNELVVFEQSACLPHYLVTIVKINIDNAPKDNLSPRDIYTQAQALKGNNPEQYFKLLCQAAEQHFNLAMFELAWCYRKGTGTGKNPQLTFEFFQKAADTGLVSAQLELGFCYKKGEGVKKDIQRALVIFTEQANKGFHPAAYYELGWHYRNGEGVPVDINQAFLYWQMAAKKGMTKAEYRVGLCYEFGWGTEKNNDNARKYYQKAAEKSLTEAETSLNNLNAQILLSKKASNSSTTNQTPTQNSPQQPPSSSCSVM